MNNTRIVELVIEDDNQELAIDAISLVSAPAIEQDFVFFGKEKNNLTFAKVDEEKRMLISPALIPNKQIFRYDPNTDSDYYVYFSPETVRKASELYLKHNNHHKATHEHNERVSGVLTVESWIIEDPKMDKSTLYGFSLPKGTWMVMLSISNDDLWSKIKSGELKGLSIEGYFTNKFEQMQKKEFTTEEVKTALKELLSVQKVELAILDSTEKQIGKIYDDIQAGKEILSGAGYKTENLGKTVILKVDTQKETLKKAEDMAKELGVDIPEISDFKKRLSNAEKAGKELISKGGAAQKL
jgi:ribosomal protein S17E